MVKIKQEIVAKLRRKLAEGQELASKQPIDLDQALTWQSEVEAFLRVLDPYGTVATVGSAYSLWVAMLKDKERGAPSQTRGVAQLRRGVLALGAILTAGVKLASRQDGRHMSWTKVKRSLKRDLESQLHKGNRLLKADPIDLSEVIAWDAETEVYMRVLDPYGSCTTPGTAYAQWDHAQWFQGNYPKTDLEKTVLFRQRLSALKAILSCEVILAEPRALSREVQGVNGQIAGYRAKSQIHCSELIQYVERLIVSEVRRDFPRTWDEDDTTRRILRSFRENLGNVRVEGFNRPVAVQWDAFKLTAQAKLEKKYGDIAVLVRINSWSGDKVEGVGFLEAKRRNRNQGIYDGISLAQLKRIRKHAPKAFVLLYDYSQMSEFSDNLLVAVSEEHAYPSHVVTRFTHALVVPMGIVEALRKNTTSLYTFGVPLSFQLCARYLRGFDLDFSESRVREIRGFAKSCGGVRYLLVITVNPVGQQAAEEAPINLELYSRLESLPGDSG